MKRLSYFLCSACIIGLLGFSACGGSDDDGGGNCNYNWFEGVSSQYAAITSAATAFGTDPSLANCNVLKSAYQSYINALKPYGDCSLLSGADRTSFENALSQAEDALPSLCD